MRFSRFTINMHESRTLVILRDALLPKLDSGKIRVADVEPYLSEKCP